MSKVTEMSTVDLYTEVRYINDQLTVLNRLRPLPRSKRKELQAYKQELLEEIRRRDNERFR